MAKLIFLPFSIGSGLLAGLIGKRAFDFVWARIDEREAPKPDQRDVDVKRLALALAVEGAVFRAVKGLVDHGSRRWFATMTGAWPGEKRSAESK